MTGEFEYSIVLQALSENLSKMIITIFKEINEKMLLNIEKYIDKL